MKYILDYKTLKLIEAIYNKDLCQLHQAIYSGALINAKIDRHKLTPLHYAVLMNFPKGVQALLNAGASVFAKTDIATKHQTPWQIARLFEYNSVSSLFNNHS